ncbi:MAG: hypothetical protein LWX83_13610 [Anaerolineae bacterium]|nr:hypothetical protein [Anaerolineae bacterium]
MNIQTSLPRRILTRLGWAAPYPLPQAGVYHYLREGEGYKARLHLRLEADGKGTLLVNASRMYHFNDTAALMAYLYLEQIGVEETARMIEAYYRVPTGQARLDYETFSQQMAVLINPQDLWTWKQPRRFRSDRLRLTAWTWP